MSNPTGRADRTRAYDPYRRLLSPDQVRALSVLRPRRAVADTVLHWGAILLAWSLAWRSGSGWGVAIAIPVVGMAYYGLFIIGHDGLHRRLFGTRRANDWFNDLFILGPIAAITRINNANHLAHHDRLATPDDPDRHKYGCFNKAEEGRLMAYLSGFATLTRSAAHVYLSKDGERQPRYSMRDILIIVGWQAALIGTLSWAFGWWGYPVLWLLPVFGFTFLMDNFRTFAEHSHPEADLKADTHRLISYLSPWWERRFVAPMSMNLHAIHHLWPSIPYYNLPAATRLVLARPDAGGLEWRRSYLQYLWRYWRALPLEECRADPSV